MCTLWGGRYCRTRVSSFCLNQTPAGPDVNFSSFAAGPSGAWRIWHEEMRKLREELQEEREALREYRERMQLQLKKQVNSLSRQLQAELQTQQKHELQQALHRLQEEVGATEASGDEESGRNGTQPRSRVLDTVGTLQVGNSRAGYTQSTLSRLQPAARVPGTQ